MPLAQVRDLLGHASITTTERYDNQQLENLQAAALKLESGTSFDPTDSRVTQQQDAMSYFLGNSRGPFGDLGLTRAFSRTKFQDFFKICANACGARSCEKSLGRARKSIRDAPTKFPFFAGTSRLKMTTTSTTTASIATTGRSTQASLGRPQRAGAGRGGALTSGFDPGRATAYISQAMALYRPQRSSPAV